MLLKITTIIAMISIVGLALFGLNQKRTDCWIDYARQVSQCQGDFKEVDHCADKAWQTYEVCERSIWH